MSKHYGFINKLSRTASRFLTQEEKDNIAEVLELPSLEGYTILGGHEYLLQYPNENYRTLDELWFSKKSKKIRSGFYIQSYEKGIDKIVLANGFHPAQLAHFTDPNHRIILFLVSSDTAWHVLRHEMVGDTYPEKAPASSIRGTLFRSPSVFGLEKVGIANNGVHLSAGPFEAVFEVVNFFGPITDIDPRENPPQAIRLMLKSGISLTDALRVIENPQVEIGGKQVDIFTATEDMNTFEAIRLWTHCN